METLRAIAQVYCTGCGASAVYSSSLLSCPFCVRGAEESHGSGRASPAFPKRAWQRYKWSPCRRRTNGSSALQNPAHQFRRARPSEVQMVPPPKKYQWSFCSGGAVKLRLPLEPQEKRDQNLYLQTTCKYPGRRNLCERRGNEPRSGETVRLGSVPCTGSWVAVGDF